MRLAAILGTLLLAAGPATAMSLTTGDFTDGGKIPVENYYPRCGGQNISPGLSWRGVPATAKSLILTMIDIDVRPSLWSHWVVVYLPPDSTGIARGQKRLPPGARGVVSNFGDTSYDGPCPPEGSGLHHYRFTLWALPNEGIAVGPNTNAFDLQAALAQVAIDRATITGTVRR
jgi:Raf kinase inhibitor-like YbhB/YbcL family protein